MGLSIEVEPSGGSGIDRTAVEMVTLATRLGLTVKAKFNGVRLLAFPNGDPVTLVTNWDAAMRSDEPHKIATTTSREPHP